MLKIVSLFFESLSFCLDIKTSICTRLEKKISHFVGCLAGSTACICVCKSSISSMASRWVPQPGIPTVMIREIFLATLTWMLSFLSSPSGGIFQLFLSCFNSKSTLFESCYGNWRFIKNSQCFGQSYDLSGKDTNGKNNTFS